MDESNIPWELLTSQNEHTVFKSKEWFGYLKAHFNIDPFIIEIKLDSIIVAYFTAFKIKRGITIVGSPIPKHATSFQGITFIVSFINEEKIFIYKCLIDFLLKETCSYIQITDFFLKIEHSDIPLIQVDKKVAYVLDLTKTESEIYKNFSQSSCRYSITKSIKQGVIIKQATNIDLFIENYYSQLIDVFKKQGLKPFYPKSLVKHLIYSLYPSGKILLLEAISKEGTCIATGIFPGDNKLATFWGGASYREFQNLCPNEPIIWEAIKYWKNKGCEYFEFGGGKKYKEKYSPEERVVIRLKASKFKIVFVIIDYIKNSISLFRVLKGKL